MVLTTKFRRPTNGSGWIQSRHDIEEAIADRVRKKKEKNHYNFKSDFEAMREIQYFEGVNISMSQPTLDSTSSGTNTTNGTTSLIDSIPVETKTNFTISPSPIDSIPVGTKTHFAISPSPIHSIPVGTKTQEPTPLTRPT